METAHPPKPLYLYIKPHGATSQKTSVLKVIVTFNYIHLVHVRSF
jgi:hypothetical protein